MHNVLADQMEKNGKVVKGLIKLYSLPRKPMVKKQNRSQLPTTQVSCGAPDSINFLYRVNIIVSGSSSQVAS